MKNLYLIALATIFLSPSVGFGQAILPLWPDGVPNQNPSEEVENKMYRDILRISNVQNPTLEVFLPCQKNRNRSGGGYLSWGVAIRFLLMIGRVSILRNGITHKELQPLS